MILIWLSVSVLHDSSSNGSLVSLLEMSLFLLRGLSRPACREALPAAARALSSASGKGANDPDGGPDSLQAYDAAEAGRPVRVHQLIGDPRTGVADDTTQPLNGEMSIEWIWTQNSTDTNWYRYALAGRDQLPNMHMDARLSDHSKNLMYLLRCKDPQR